MQTSATRRRHHRPLSTTLSARTDPFRAIVVLPTSGDTTSEPRRRSRRAAIIGAWLAAGGVSWAAIAGAWWAFASLL